MAVIRVLGRPWVDAIFRALIVVALVVGVWAALGQRQLTRCQAAYAEASNRSTAARAHAAEEDREALDELVSAVVRDPHAGLDALREYERVRAAADARRAANPVPPPPSNRCG